jgi:hypothetical protein
VTSKALEDKSVSVMRKYRVLGAIVLAFGLAACSPVLVREYHVTPNQVGDSGLELKVGKVLVPFGMESSGAGPTQSFGFRRQWPNLATGRPGAMSVTFTLDDSGNAWAMRLREWPVVHQTHFGADVETALVDDLSRAGYKLSRTK